MQPKTALVVLLTITIILSIFFAFLYVKQNTNKTGDVFNKTSQELDEAGLKGAIDKSHQAEGLTPAEEEQLDKAINKKIDDRVKQLESKSEEEIKTQGYTQAELDFIANPEATIKEELGLESEQDKVNFFTQEELDKIANQEYDSNNISDSLDIEGALPEPPN